MYKTLFYKLYMTREYFTIELKTEKIPIRILNVCSYSPVKVLENEINSFQRGA